MTINPKQREDIITLCKQLKDDTRKSLRIMTTPEIAEKTHLEATQAFKKSHAAYILAMDAYLNLPRWRHPNLRHRDSVQEALGTLLTQAKLLTDTNDKNMLAINSQLDLKQYLKANADEHAAVKQVKRNADAKPGKHLSTLLMEHTDYQPTPVKKRPDKKHSPQETTGDTQKTTQAHAKKLRRKVSEPEENTNNTAASLKKKISTTIKRKASGAGSMIKQKSKDTFPFLYLPSKDEKKKKKTAPPTPKQLAKARIEAKATSTFYHDKLSEEAKRALAITAVFDESVSSVSSMQSAPRKRQHDIIKSQEETTSDASKFEEIALSSGTPTKQSFLATPSDSGKIKRRDAKKTNGGSGHTPNGSPRFWKRTPERKKIDKDSRSKSSMSLGRTPTKQ